MNLASLLGPSWKTSATGYLTAGLAIAAIIWPQHAEKFTKIIGIVSGLGLMAARDNNVTSEQAQAKPATPIGENINRIVGVLLIGFALVFSFMGCANTPENSLRARATAVVARIAAKDGTYFTLKEHPEWRKEFERAANDIEALVALEKLDMAALAEIVGRLDVRELKGETARLVIGDVQIIVEELAPNKGTMISQERLTNPRVVARAIVEGIRQGIAAAPRSD